jgi:hypothetical protein
MGCSCRAGAWEVEGVRCCQTHSCVRIDEITMLLPVRTGGSHHCGGRHKTQRTHTTQRTGPAVVSTHQNAMIRRHVRTRPNV